jgi:hypothetical protein
MGIPHTHSLTDITKAVLKTGHASPYSAHMLGEAVQVKQPHSLLDKKKSFKVRSRPPLLPQVRFKPTSPYMRGLLFEEPYDQEGVKADWSVLLGSNAEQREEFIRKHRASIIDQVKEYGKVICK